MSTHPVRWEPEESSSVHPQLMRECLDFTSITMGPQQAGDATQLLAVIKCIHFPPTYLHFMKYIEDGLLLTSSTTFVDLLFQEHRMMEKNHMDQNPYITSLCPKPWLISYNMTQGEAKSPGPTDPWWGRLSPLLGRSARVTPAMKLGYSATLDGRPAYQVGPQAPLSPKAPT
jgi:hypothetical protein